MVATATNHRPANQTVPNNRMAKTEKVAEEAGQTRRYQADQHAGNQSRTSPHGGRHRKAVRRRRDHAPGRRPARADRGHFDRQPVARHRPGRPGHSPRPDHRDLRPGIERQDDARPARGCPGPKGRRHCRVHRRRTCPRSELGQEAGRRSRNAARQPAQLRRRSDAHHRDAHQVERRRRDRHRLGGRPGAQEGTRRRNRRHARRPAGPADEPVDAQADRRDRQEPAPR